MTEGLGGYIRDVFSDGNTKGGPDRTQPADRYRSRRGVRPERGAEQGKMQNTGGPEFEFVLAKGRQDQEREDLHGRMVYLEGSSWQWFTAHYSAKRTFGSRFVPWGKRWAGGPGSAQNGY